MVEETFRWYKGNLHNHTNKSDGDKPIHVNALGITRTLSPEHGRDAVAVLKRNVDSVRAAGGLPKLRRGGE